MYGVLEESSTKCAKESAFENSRFWRRFLWPFLYGYGYLGILSMLLLYLAVSLDRTFFEFPLLYTSIPLHFMRQRLYKSLGRFQLRVVPIYGAIAPSSSISLMNSLIRCKINVQIDLRLLPKHLADKIMRGMYGVLTRETL